MREDIKRRILLFLTVIIIFFEVKQMMEIKAYASQVTGALINVTKIDGIDDDFIMGMDVSSYVSVTNSGVVFKDFDGKVLDDAGFFKLLKSCGINYIRIRVWNDPYDDAGNGYGGGNCDINNAAVIGKLATNAGMKVLIDFHYSDFWADPSRQNVPKEWKNYSLAEKETAIYEYTKESLNYLKNQGVNVGMVQIGNETTNAFCGETNWNNMCKLFSAGSKAVREFDSSVLIALHFTDPQKNRYNEHATYLKNNGVDYDVFASSFYPGWHKDLANLTSQLKNIINKYNKKVMIVETSYPYTLEEWDGHRNELNKWDNSNPPVAGFPEATVQGQADYMANIIKAVADLGDSAIGVCYWEGAWNSVGNVYPNGNWSQTVADKNRKLWEKYGSGWTTSYASSYDKNVTEVGGSAVDNQTFFDVNGKALASLNVFKYVKTGATTEVEKEEETTTKGETITTTKENTTGEKATSIQDTTTSSETSTSTETTTSTETLTSAETTTNEASNETNATDEETANTGEEIVNSDNDAKENKGKKTGIIIGIAIAILSVGAALLYVIIKRKKI